MGHTASQILAHPSPVDHRGNFTSYARHRQNAIGVDAVSNIMSSGPGKDVVPPSLGQVFSGLLLAVFAIVSALSLQKAIDYGFKLLMPSGENGWRLLSLFLQFLLVFSFLVFFAFVFAG